MFKEYDPQELVNKRIELEGMKETIKNLFINHPAEFPDNEENRKLVSVMMMGASSFDFFFARKIYGRAEIELTSAFGAYDLIMHE